MSTRVLVAVQEVLVAVDAVCHIRFQRAEALVGGVVIEYEAAADAGDVEHIVDIRLPIVRRPVDGIGDDGGNAFGNAVGGDHIEGFGVAGLKQQVHVADGSAKFLPGLPAVEHEVDMRETVEHFLDSGKDTVTTAFDAAGREPELEGNAHAAGDFQRGGCGAHEVFQRTRGAEDTDAEVAAVKGLLSANGLACEVVEVREEGARGTESSLNPMTESPGVAGEVNVCGSELDLHDFANEFYAVAVGLKKPDV